MPAIGILGGMGPQASTRLYELLIERTQKYSPAAVDDDYPEIVLLNVPVPNFILNKDNLPEARQMLIERTRLLEKAGCVVNGIACNTAHVLLPELQAVTTVPFLSIPQLVAEQVGRLGVKRVGLLATPTTLASAIYDESLRSIATLVRPDRETAEQTENYVHKQLANSITAADRRAFRELVAQFRRSAKLDAVILGCTELPLVYGANTDNETVIDTLRLLADGLLARYYKYV